MAENEILARALADNEPPTGAGNSPTCADPEVGDQPADADASPGRPNPPRPRLPRELVLRALI